MPPIQWSPSLSVGIDIFDDEHKKLISIINTLETALGAGVDQERLQEICDELVEYTLLHFRHEEMYFDDWNYPGKDAHVLSHTELKRQVFDYRRQLLERSSSDLAEDLMEFLYQWLVQHIQSEDRAYGAFLGEKGLR